MKRFSGRVKGQRKFIVALLALAASTALTGFGLLAGSEFVTALGLILTAFNAGNVGEHYVTKDQDE